MENFIKRNFQNFRRPKLASIKSDTKGYTAANAEENYPSGFPFLMVYRDFRSRLSCNPDFKMKVLEGGGARVSCVCFAGHCNKKNK